MFIQNETKPKNYDAGVSLDMYIVNQNNKYQLYNLWSVPIFFVRSQIVTDQYRPTITVYCSLRNTIKFLIDINKTVNMYTWRQADCF